MDVRRFPYPVVLVRDSDEAVAKTAAALRALGFSVLANNDHATGTHLVHVTILSAEDEKLLDQFSLEYGDQEWFTRLEEADQVRRDWEARHLGGWTPPDAD
jgi:hypothetical protein